MSQKSFFLAKDHWKKYQNVTKLIQQLKMTYKHNETNFHILCINQCWEIASPNFEVLVL